MVPRPRMPLPAVTLVRRLARALGLAAVAGLLVLAWVGQAEAQPRRVTKGGAKKGRPGKPAAEGALVLRSSVEGASVWVNGNFVGLTPQRTPLPLAPGNHTVKVTKEGYSDFLDVAEIRAKKTTELVVEIFPLTAAVSVTSDPPGAYVVVDGKALGRTPFSGTVEPGQRTLTLKLEGYLDARKEVSLVAGEAYEVELTLVASPVAAAPRRRGGPIYKKWWFWAATGAAAVATTAVIIVATDDGDPLAGAEHTIRPPF